MIEQQQCAQPDIEQACLHLGAAYVEALCGACRGGGSDCKDLQQLLSPSVQGFIGPFQATAVHGPHAFLCSFLQHHDLPPQHAGQSDWRMEVVASAAVTADMRASVTSQAATAALRRPVPVAASKIVRRSPPHSPLPAHAALSAGTMHGIQQASCSLSTPGHVTDSARNTAATPGHTTAPIPNAPAHVLTTDVTHAAAALGEATHATSQTPLATPAGIKEGTPTGRGNLSGRDPAGVFGTSGGDDRQSRGNDFSPTGGSAASSARSSMAGEGLMADHDVIFLWVDLVVASSLPEDGDCRRLSLHKLERSHEGTIVRVMVRTQMQDSQRQQLLGGTNSLPQVPDIRSRSPFARALSPSSAARPAGALSAVDFPVHAIRAVLAWVSMVDSRYGIRDMFGTVDSSVCVVDAFGLYSRTGCWDSRRQARAQLAQLHEDFDIRCVVEDVAVDRQHTLAFAHWSAWVVEKATGRQGLVSSLDVYGFNAACRISDCIMYRCPLPNELEALELRPT